MTRKDFQLIADTIRQSRDAGTITDEQAYRLARDFCYPLRSTNPRFDAERFIEAATK